MDQRTKIKCNFHYVFVKGGIHAFYLHCEKKKNKKQVSLKNSAVRWGRRCCLHPVATRGRRLSAEAGLGVGVPSSTALGRRGTPRDGPCRVAHWLSAAGGRGGRAPCGRRGTQDASGHPRPPCRPHWAPRRPAAPYLPRDLPPFVTLSFMKRLFPFNATFIFNFNEELGYLRHISCGPQGPGPPALRPEAR